MFWKKPKKVEYKDRTFLLYRSHPAIRVALGNIVGYFGLDSRGKYQYFVNGVPTGHHTTYGNTFGYLSYRNIVTNGMKANHLEEAMYGLFDALLDKEEDDNKRRLKEFTEKQHFNYLINKVDEFFDKLGVKNED